MISLKHGPSLHRLFGMQRRVSCVARNEWAMERRGGDGGRSGDEEERVSKTERNGSREGGGHTQFEG